MSKERAKKSGLKHLPPAQRQAVSTTRDGHVATGYAVPECPLPLMVYPRTEGVAPSYLASWAIANRSFLQTKLIEHGALLFRGFGVKTITDFESLARALADRLLDYTERSSPRSQLGDKIYTSTNYPPDQSIFLHNEQSYNVTFPLKLFFFCEVAARCGGETPIASTRRIFARLSEQTRSRLIEKGWSYVRNFGSGFGLDWETAFQTSRQAEVEDYCRSSGLEFEWKDGNRLRTRQVRPAMAKHPLTGEMVWFNHATFFHVSTLEPGMREALLSNFDEEDLPNNTYYGDGTPFEPAVIEELRQAYLDEAVTFPWQQGDVLMLDNMLTAHGRRPFIGPRRVLFAMADPVATSVGSTRRCPNARTDS